MGLAGVTLLAAVLIAATSALLFARLAEQGANPVVAIVVMLLAGSAATVHWLARPHLFTCLFFLLAVRLLEADAARPSRRLWLLAPLAALWANLHGGFVILFAVLGCWAAGVAPARAHPALPGVGLHSQPRGGVSVAPLPRGEHGGV
jgi:hypothetical protein